jgi:hypothetical protein
MRRFETKGQRSTALSALIFNFVAAADVDLLTENVAFKLKQYTVVKTGRPVMRRFGAPMFAVQQLNFSHRQ